MSKAEEVVRVLNGNYGNKLKLKEYERLSGEKCW